MTRRRVLQTASALSLGLTTTLHAQPAPALVIWFTVEGAKGAPAVFAAVAAPSPDAALTLRVLLDWSSVEVFVGADETVITQQVFARGDDAHADHTGVRLFAERGTAHFASGQAWLLARAQFS